MTNVTNKTDKARPIVVGVDGSTSSRKALAWAAKQAELTNSPLTALISWKHSADLDRSGVLPKVADHEPVAKETLESTIVNVLGKESPITVTQSVVEGHPSQVLVEASKSAELLVVGSRGHGEFIGMILGSVSQFVAGHALCPVVIVRDEEDAASN